MDSYLETLIRAMQSKGWKITLSKKTKEALRVALVTISPRNKEITELKYRENKTLSQIGSKYGLTKERVRQITELALHDLWYQTNINKDLPLPILKLKLMANLVGSIDEDGIKEYYFSPEEMNAFHKAVRVYFNTTVYDHTPNRGKYQYNTTDISIIENACEDIEY